MQVRKVWSVGYQTSSLDVFLIAVNGGKVRAHCQKGNAGPVGGYKWIASDIKGFNLTPGRLDGGCDILGTPDFRCGDLKAKSACSRLDLTDVQNYRGIINVRHDRQIAEAWDNFAQDFETLASKIGRLIC